MPVFIKLYVSSVLLAGLGEFIRGATNNTERPLVLFIWVVAIVEFSVATILVVKKIRQWKLRRLAERDSE